MQTVRKYLVYEYVPIMEKTFRSGTRENCVAQRSIYVMLRGNEETRRYINQVRNALIHLISVSVCVIRQTVTNLLIRLQRFSSCRNSRILDIFQSNEV